MLLFPFDIRHSTNNQLHSTFGQMSTVVSIMSVTRFPCERYEMLIKN